MRNLIRNRLTQTLSLLLAAALQVMPMLRQLLPATEQGLTPSAWAFVFQLATGAAALFGYHAISGASSIAISPATALQGVPYNGTITYSGSHAGSVNSWKGSVNWTSSVAGNCSSAYAIAPGLSIVSYSKNTCTVTGTPTNTGTYSFTMKIYSSSTCGSGDSDTRSTSIAIGSTNSGNFAPTWSLTPPAQVALAGSDTVLNAAALGKPTPGYAWFNGLTFVGTGSIISLTNIQISKAGLYTVSATNGVAPNISTNAYLTVISCPSTTLFHFTNYLANGSSTNMVCIVSNVPGVFNKYQWQKDGANIPAFAVPSAITSNLTVTAAGSSPFTSGTYTIALISYTTNTSPTNLLVGLTTNTPAGYDSYWQFGSKPTVITQPASITNAPGSAATFSVTATGDTGLAVDTNLVPVGSTQDQFGRSMLGTNYQWFSTNGAVLALAGQTNATLNFSSVDPTNAGNYFVVVTNVYGAVTSSVVSLTVAASGVAPNITAQPSSQIVPQGANVQLSAAASGTPTPTFQWQKGGINLADGTTGFGSTYSGSQSSQLNITGAMPGDSGSYTLGVTNSSGGTASSAAQLLVIAPPTGAQSPQLARNIVGGQFGISFTALQGYRYLVLRSTNLGPTANWVTLTNLPPAFSNYIFNFGDGFGNPSAFYRTFMTNN